MSRDGVCKALSRKEWAWNRANLDLDLSFISFVTKSKSRALFKSLFPPGKGRYHQPRSVVANVEKMHRKHEARCLAQRREAFQKWKLSFL